MARLVGAHIGGGQEDDEEQEQVLANKVFVILHTLL